MASDLGLHCLSMSHKNDARVIWVNSSLHCYFRSHYKEYLVGLINKNKVDPVDIMGVQELERCFARRGKQAPKPRNESEGQYRKRLAQVTDNLFYDIF